MWEGEFDEDEMMKGYNMHWVRVNERGDGDGDCNSVLFFPNRIGLEFVWCGVVWFGLAYYYLFPGL